VPGRILAIGGFSLGSAFDDLVLELAGGPRLFVPTASSYPETMLDAFSTRASRVEPSRRTRCSTRGPPADLRELALRQKRDPRVGGKRIGPEGETALQARML
jgi:hypothetical protein